jgi:hypothetical protein
MKTPNCSEVLPIGPVAMPIRRSRTPGILSTFTTFGVEARDDLARRGTTLRRQALPQRPRVREAAARPGGIAYATLDNGIRPCADPRRLQALADGLSAAKIDAVLRKWLDRLPHPFTVADRRAGYWYACSILQLKCSLTQVLDRPVTGQLFFWMRRYAACGAAALRAKRRGRKVGEQPTLTRGQETTVQRLLVDKTHDQLKLTFALWSRQAVRELLRLRFGVAMPIRTVGLYLSRCPAEAGHAGLRAAAGCGPGLAHRDLRGHRDPGQAGGGRDPLGRRDRGPVGQRPGGAGMRPGARPPSFACRPTATASA